MVVIISNNMFKKWERQAEDDWLHEIADNLLSIYPDYILSLGASQTEVLELCRITKNYAKSLEIFEKRDVFKLAVLSLSLGAHFCKDPRLQYGISHSLARRSIPSDRRLSSFSQYADTWLQSFWGKESLPDFGKRLVRILRDRFAVPDAAASITVKLRPLLRNISDPDQYNAFFAACSGHAEQYGLHSKEATLAYCGCAMTQGVYWFQDPIMRSLRREMEVARSPDDLHTCLSDFYERFS